MTDTVPTAATPHLLSRHEHTLERTRKRLKHFRRKHHYADAFRARSMFKEAAMLDACNETELLAFCTHCGNRWWVPNKCRTRVCPLCSWEVTKDRVKYLNAMTRHMKHPKMITLTMPRWTRDPHEGIKHLRNSWAKLRKTRVFKTVRGGAYQIELKQKEDGWHIHMHALLDAPYIAQQVLFTQWSRITGIEVPQIDIRSASDPKAREYVVKYASKGAAFDTAHTSIVDWYLATKGERLFATFGLWYNATINQLDPDGNPLLPPCACPFCKMENTVRLARDGPFLYDPDAWRVMFSTIAVNGEIERLIPGVREMVNNKEIQCPTYPNTPTQEQS
jgi:hypothetical protein